MTTRFFKEGDFEPCRKSRSHGYVVTTKEAAEYANAKLLEEGRVVYGSSSDDYTFGLGKDKQDKEQALLICIEPLEPEHKHVWVCSCGEKHD